MSPRSMTTTLLALLAVATLGAVPLEGAERAAAPASAIVTLSADSPVVRPGEIVYVTVKIQQARNVGSVPFTLHYDPAILELVPGLAAEGAFLARDRAPTTFLASAGPASRPGSVLVGLSRMGVAKGAQGKGVLCRLAFRARVPGVSPLTFSSASVLDPSANQIAATFRGSSLRVKPRA